MPSSDPPTKYAIALFPGFQALDAFGPLDILNILSITHPLELSVLAETTAPVSTLCDRPLDGHSTIGQSVVPTHTFADAPEDIEVLIVPGGKATRFQDLTQPVVDFVAARYPKLRYLLTVCTGSGLVARTGILDGRRATSNKTAFEWIKTQGPKVDWVRQARWVTDGNIWTSSGVSAGIDMTYAFVADQYGEEAAEKAARGAEYVYDKNVSSSHDPFCGL